jgi:uncharacterized protein
MRPRPVSPVAAVFQAELQLSVFIRAGDMFAGRPLYDEIVDRARAAGLRGATAVSGLQGFGGSAGPEPPGLAARDGLRPVLIEITDDPDRVRAFLPVLDELVGSGLVVLHTVTAVRRAADLPDITTSAAT